MFHFELAQMMQARLPFAVLLKVLSRAFGKQNVAGIAAIHHTLRHVNAATREVGAAIHIDDLIYRAAMNAHPHIE